MKVDFSIIIPIYNSEKYIEKCILSILSNNTDNIEVILVDDGSTDNTEFIYKKYTNKYKFIKVFKIKNSGVSEARNFGLKKSKGEYCIFLDSDDMLESTALDLIKTTILNNDVDLILFDSIRFIDNKIINSSKINIIDNHVLTDINILAEKLLFTNEIRSVCMKVFRTKLIKDYNINFDKNIKYGEDWRFCCNYIKNISKYIYLNKPLYRYRYNHNSATNKFSINRTLDTIENIKYKYFLIEDWDINIDDYNEKLNIQTIENILRLFLTPYTMNESRDYCKLHTKKLCDNDFIYEKLYYNDIKSLSILKLLLINLIKNKSYNKIHIILCVYGKYVKFKKRGNKE